MRCIRLLSRPTLSALCVVIATGITPMLASEASDKEVIAYRKAVEGGRELVVVRGPNLPASDLPGLLSDAHLREVKGVFPIRVELCAPGRAPLPVAALLIYERAMPGHGFGGFDVLDASVDRANVVLATAENGAILLRKMNAFGEIRCALLRGGDWSLHAAIIPLDRTMVSVKLAWTQDRLVEAHVEDLRRPNLRNQSRFVQTAKDVWHFKCLQRCEGGEKTSPGVVSP